jgi:hypothetical protein
MSSTANNYFSHGQRVIKKTPRVNGGNTCDEDDQSTQARFDRLMNANFA